MLRGRYSPVNYTSLAGKLDHGLLLGLLDDDHPYLSLDGEATNVTNGTFDLATTGSGRFDGGMGIGTDPTFRSRLYICDSNATRIGIQLDNIGAGDVSTIYDLGGVSKFIAGVDATDDKYKISVGGVLETNTALTIDSSGNFDFGSGNFANVGTIGCGAITGGTYNTLSVIPQGVHLFLSGDGTTDTGLDIAIPIASGNDFFYGYGGTEHHKFGNSSQAEISDDGLITAAGFVTAGTIEGTEIFNSGGDLKIQPDVQGNVILFGDTDVSNGAHGKTLQIHRKAPEGDYILYLYIDSGEKGVFTCTAPEMLYSGVGKVIFEADAGAYGESLHFQPSANADIEMFAEAASGENPFVKQAGYITAATDERWISWQVEDTTDYFVLAREDTYIAGFKINMPLQMGDDDLIAVDVNSGITASTTQSQGQGALTAQVNEISTVANDGDTITLPSAVTGIEIEIINNGANTLRIYPASGDDLGLGVNTFEELEANERVALVAYGTTNWAKASTTEIIHAEIHDEDNTDAFVINAEDDFHSYHTNGLAAGDLADWAFDAGGAGTSHAIASIADGADSGVDIAVTTADNHLLEDGDIVSQTNLTSAVYTGVFVVKDIISPTIYEVAAVYTATDTGTMNQAATLEADAVAAGVYSFAYYISATLVGNNETFDFQLYKGATAVTGSKVRRKFSITNDFGSMSGGGVVAVANGDKISFALSNEDSVDNIILRNLTIVLIRL